MPFQPILSFSPAVLNTAAFAQQRWNEGPWGPGGMMGWGGMGWAGGFIMIVFWIIVLAAIIIFIRWAVSSKGPASSAPEQRESALDILKKRYARGEIDKEEFEQKKRDLS